jgi:hypothetical protein
MTMRRSHPRALFALENFLRSGEVLGHHGFKPQPPREGGGFGIHAIAVPLLLFLAAIVLMTSIWAGGNTLSGCASSLCTGDDGVSMKPSARLFLPVWFEAAEPSFPCVDDGVLLSRVMAEGCTSSSAAPPSLLTHTQQGPTGS